MRLQFMLSESSNGALNETIGQIPSNLESRSADWLTASQSVSAASDWIEGDSVTILSAPTHLPDYGTIMRNELEPELQRVLPALPPLGITRRWAGYIDAAPDLVPVLGEVPRLRGFVLATGFSGHGFAMGPIAGRLVAELIADGKTSLDITGFRFSRFAEGAVGRPRNVL